MPEMNSWLIIFLYTELWPAEVYLKQYLDPSKTKNVKHRSILKYYKLISNVLVSKSNILKTINLTEFNREQK